MSNYTKLTNFAAKDALATGNASKRVKGSEIDTEYNNIAVAVATKADTSSPTFTGTVTAAALTASGLLTVSGNRVTVSNATTPMYEMHVPGVVAGAISCASGEVFRVHSTNGSGVFSSKLMAITSSGAATFPLQPQFRAYRATDQTSGDEVIFDTEVVDNTSSYNNTTGRFTAPVSGVYAFSWCVPVFDTSGIAGTEGLYLKVDGTTVVSTQLSSIAASGVVTHTGSCNVLLTAGQYVSLDKYAGSYSGATRYVWGSALTAQFSGILLA